MHRLTRGGRICAIPWVATTPGEGGADAQQGVSPGDTGPQGRRPRARRGDPAPQETLRSEGPVDTDGPEVLRRGRRARGPAREDGQGEGLRPAALPRRRRRDTRERPRLPHELGLRRARREARRQRRVRLAARRRAGASQLHPLPEGLGRRPRGEARGRPDRAPPVPSAAPLALP